MIKDTIEAFRNYIIFSFIEDTTGGRFINSVNGQIVVTSDDKEQTTNPRWGKVTQIGPDVDGVSIDDYILVEAGKWTSHFHINETKFWKTDDNCVLAVSDEPGTTY